MDLLFANMEMSIVKNRFFKFASGHAKFEKTIKHPTVQYINQEMNLGRR